MTELDKLKNSINVAHHFVNSQARSQDTKYVMDELDNALGIVKNLITQRVVGRSEQLVCPHCNGNGKYIDTNPERYGLKTCECQAS